MPSLTAFARICNLIPPFLCSKIAKELGIAKKARTFSFLSHVVSMMWSHISHALRLNDVCDCLRAHWKALNSIRNCTPPSRNNLAYANKERPAEFIRRLFWATIAHFQSTHPLFFTGGKGRVLFPKFPKRFKRCIQAIDSSTIQLVANCMDWAKHRRKKAALKLHTAINILTFLLVRLIVEEASHHDATRMIRCCCGAGSGDIVIFDKAYLALEELLKLTSRGVFWVTRAKENMRYKVVRNLKLGSDKNSISGQEVRWTGEVSDERYGGKTVRRVEARVTVDGEERIMVFLTNNMEWAPSSICDLYASRWAIETFFKEIKQTLKIKSFMGYTPNAIEWQVWTGMLTYVLMRFMMYLSKWRLGFKHFFTLMRGIIWVKTDPVRVAAAYGTAGVRLLNIQCRVEPQIPYLPGFEPAPL